MFKLFLQYDVHIMKKNSVKNIILVNVTIKK